MAIVASIMSIKLII